MVALALCLAASRAVAEVPVEIVDRAGARLVVDGALRDWGTEFTRVDQRVDVTAGAASWRGASDASVRFALAQDATALWVAAEITDDRLVRSSAHRAADDALVLTFAVDDSPLREIALYPGEPGRSSGAVRWIAGGAGAVVGADVVEAVVPQGFSIEARVPWGALSGLNAAVERLRVRVSYRDADGGADRSVIATSGGRGADAIPLTVNARRVSAAPADPLASFRAERGVGSDAALFDRGADLAGDSRSERVVVFPGYLVVSGPGVMGSSGYLFAELASRDGGDISNISLRDVTGDGRSDVVLTQRVRVAALIRELVTVYSLDARGALRRVFAHEVLRSEGGATLRNELSWPRVGAVRVAFSQNTGWTRERWAESADAELTAALAPWTAHRERTYRWDAATNSFLLERSLPNVAADAAAPQLSAPAAPAAPAADVDAVLALFRQRENLAADARPSHRAAGDVVDDATLEQLHIYGRVLVVFGPRFLGGRSYYSLSLPIAEGDSVLSLDVVDVTGDQRGEAIVRVRRNVTTRVRGAEIPSHRDMLLAYSIDPARRGRLFAAEIGRSVGGDSIANEVTLPQRSGSQIVVRAGRATGWTESNYPFHDVPQERVFPLLLPWDRSAQRVVYQWNGSAFERAP